MLQVPKKLSDENCRSLQRTLSERYACPDGYSCVCSPCQEVREAEVIDLSELDASLMTDNYLAHMANTLHRKCP